MNDGSADEPVYAPPTARLAAEASPASPKRRFWMTCLCCAGLLLGLALLIDRFSLDPSDAQAVGCLLVLWLLPTTWILWPELKRPGGFRRLRWRRFVGISLGFAASTVFLFCALAVLAVIVFTIGQQLWWYWQ